MIYMRSRKIFNKLTLGLKIILIYAILNWLLYLFFAFTIPIDLFVIINLSLPPFMIYGICKLKKWGLYLRGIYYLYATLDSLHFLLFPSIIISAEEILFQVLLGIIVPIIIIFYFYRKREIFID